MWQRYSCARPGGNPAGKKDKSKNKNNKAKQNIHTHTQRERGCRSYVTESSQRVGEHVVRKEHVRSTN